MNTLIRELARRADAEARAKVPDLRDIPLYTHERDLQFALLIVKECMSNLYLNGYDDAMIQIQRHFGVEE
jgi:hypothetical protein